MKKILLAIIVLSILICSTAFAFDSDQSKEQDQLNPLTQTITETNLSAKPTVVTIFVNNAKSTYDKELTKKITERFNARLTPYEVKSDGKYLELLNKAGITDVSLAEKSDIVSAVNDGTVDYLVYTEIQPPIINSWVSFFNVGVKATVTIPLKIIDIKHNKYLYNSKFTDTADNSTMLGGVGTKAAVLGAMDKIFNKTDEVLTTRLPLK